MGGAECLDLGCGLHVTALCLSALGGPASMVTAGTVEVVVTLPRPPPQVWGEAIGRVLARRLRTPEAASLLLVLKGNLGDQPAALAVRLVREALVAEWTHLRKLPGDPSPPHSPGVTASGQGLLAAAGSQPPLRGQPGATPAAQSPEQGPPGPERCQLTGWSKSRSGSNLVTRW